MIEALYWANGGGSLVGVIIPLIFSGVVVAYFALKGEFRIKATYFLMSYYLRALVLTLALSFSSSTESFNSIHLVNFASFFCIALSVIYTVNPFAAYVFVLLTGLAADVILSMHLFDSFTFSGIGGAGVMDSLFVVPLVTSCVVHACNKRRIVWVASVKLYGGFKPIK